LGFDKLETEAIARRIGTFEVSIQKAQGCQAAPDMPSTMAKLNAVLEAEALLDMDAMADAAIKVAYSVDI
jgi:tRNA uracil 4-sulfurtransferase